MDRGAWQATVHGITKSRTQRSNWTTTIRQTVIWGKTSWWKRGIKCRAKWPTNVQYRAFQEIKFLYRIIVANIQTIKPVAKGKQSKICKRGSGTFLKRVVLSCWTWTSKLPWVLQLQGHEFFQQPCASERLQPWLTPWWQPWEPFSRWPSQAVLGLLTHGNRGTCGYSLLCLW